jgi:hypothetical protein
LHDLKAEAWVGVPLSNAEGRACGLIAAIFGRPLDDDGRFVELMLTMFVPRASAELNRKREEDALQESEQRYHAFIQLNPDAFWRLEFEEPIDTALPEKEQLERIHGTGYFAECNLPLEIFPSCRRPSLRTFLRPPSRVRLYWPEPYTRVLRTQRRFS